MDSFDLKCHDFSVIEAIGIELSLKMPKSSQSKKKKNTKKLKNAIYFLESNFTK